MKKVEKYKPESYPHLFFRVLSVLVWLTTASFIVEIGLPLCGNSDKKITYMAMIGEIVGIIAAIIFHSWIKKFYYKKKEEKNYSSIFIYKNQGI